MSNFLVFLSSFSLLLLFGSSISNNITNTQYLKDPQVLVSSNSIFKFGFFSPGNSSNRYVGIWYDTNNDSDLLEVIWVANRDNPLKDSSGVLNISKDGHLQLLNGENHTFWSSNSTATHEVDIESDLFLPGIFAQLQDSGNLVLLSNASGGSIFWQSFHHPTNSLLPRMEVAFNKTTNNSKQLKSWKTTTDPSTGRFRAGVDPRMLPEVFIWDGDRPYWRSGPWNGHVFIGVPSMYYFVLVDGFSLEDNQEGVINLSFTTSDKSATRHYVLSYDGVITQKDWDNDTMNWTIIWQSLQSECDIYGKCGEFGRCRSNDSEICGCLKGFEPRNRKEWRKGNWSSGCVRKTPLQCGGANGEEEEDGFWKLRNIKVPDYAEWLHSDNEGHCRRQCLRNCSCIAYAYHSGIGCMIWTGSLVDIQDFSSLGVDLFVRLAHSNLAKEFGSKWRLILAVTIGVGGATLVLVTFCIWRRTRRKNSEKNAIYNGKQIEAIKLEKLQDLQLFQLNKLAAATNNFDDRNKLGQGGFGPVFKGKFEDGQEIAVKRLSKASGQGLQEFMNEVDVIAKLQHRNLVKLLGCCVDGEEKMLVYEYMPNKSLDAFLFDPKNQEFLDWKKRYKIIEGICRGILYLHRDSRLKIIHRDLKPSNILLDDDLSAKISDFGMARIFGVKEDQGSTRRVVGTYGYMSPEYAMEGRFSEKSDVFSFGVLLLEIICGRKNSSFIDDESWSLIGHAWKLRNEDNVISLIDPRINDPSSYEEILKCIEVGLLCVQEVPEERPSIYTIISMLDSVITDLPKPTQPVFTQTKYYYPKRFPQICDQESVNNLTYTSHISGR